MGFLGLPNKQELIKRIAKAIAGEADERIDTPEEREKLAQKMADEFNLPILNEEEEKKVFVSLLEAAHNALEGLERFI